MSSFSVLSQSIPKLRKCWDMETEACVVDLEKGTICSSWNYNAHRLASASIDGSLSIFDSRNPSSSSFYRSSKFTVHDSGIVKVVWIPPEYGDALACISVDGALSLWEEVEEVGQPLQWKLCKNFTSNSSQVVDVQFGVSLSGLKMVIAFSEGYIKVYELLDPLELKNWQLQAEFQNAGDSVSTLGKASCSSASISWKPQRGESQESSFTIGFNSDTPQLNSPKGIAKSGQLLLYDKPPIKLTYQRRKKNQGKGNERGNRDVPGTL